MFFKFVDTIKNCWKSNGKVKFLIVALGIFVSFVYVGIFQETIMRGCYGDSSKNCKNGERYKYAMTLVFVKTFCGLIFIKVLDLINREKKIDTTHALYYASSAAANSLAMVSANMSLSFVSYPMQVIFKSAKPLSVMLLGLMFCKKYTIQRYFFVLIIVTGVVVFKLFEAKDDKPRNKPSEHNNISDMQSLMGTALLVFSLTMDGILGGIQDRMRAVHAPTFRKLMFNTCLWGCGYLIIAILATREFMHVIPFIGRHPNALWHLITLGIADAIGNMFIFTMISCFGALACSVTGTVRKFFSVIFSIIFFGNPSTLLQWVGACLVFAGLLADAACGKGKKKHVEKVENGDIEKADSNVESKIDNFESNGKTGKFSSQNSPPERGFDINANNSSQQEQEVRRI